MSASMRLRGLELSVRNLLTRPAPMFEALAVPLMLRSAKIAEELAAAAVARGIDRPGRKTAYRRPAFRALDAAALAGTALACGALVAVRLHEGRRGGAVDARPDPTRGRRGPAAQARPARAGVARRHVHLRGRDAPERRGRDPFRGGGRMRGAVRRIGLRQDHRHAAGERACGRILRGRAPRRGARGRRAAPEPFAMGGGRAGGQRVPEPAHAVLQPRHHRRDRLRHGESGRAPRRNARAHGLHRAGAGHRGPARPQHLRAVRRAEASRGVRGRAHVPPRRLRAGRAVQQPRPCRDGRPRAPHPHRQATRRGGAGGRASAGLSGRCGRPLHLHARGARGARMDGRGVRRPLRRRAGPPRAALAAPARPARAGGAPRRPRVGRARLRGPRARGGIRTRPGRAGRLHDGVRRGVGDGDHGAERRGEKHAFCRASAV